MKFILNYAVINSILIRYHPSFVPYVCTEILVRNAAFLVAKVNKERATTLDNNNHHIPSYFTVLFLLFSFTFFLFTLLQ